MYLCVSRCAPGYGRAADAGKAVQPDVGGVALPPSWWQPPQRRVRQPAVQADPCAPLPVPAAPPEQSSAGEC